MRRFLPVIVLVILAPITAELLYGTVSIGQFVALLFALPIYGAGALLIREMVRRSGRGWGSILLLGVAYAVVEEGLALQSFFSPTLYHAAQWGARLVGVNWVYVEVQLVLHAVWSIAIPILITELIFPTIRRREPYLGRFGLVVTAIFYILGVLLMLSPHTQLDPGYWAPPVDLVIAGAVVVVLAVVALAVLPKDVSMPLRQVAPHPLTLFALAGVSGFAYLAGLILLWRVQPAFAHWPLVLVLMLCAAILAVGVGLLIRRWSRSYEWGDRHLLALASGALITHTLVGLVDFQNATPRLELGVLGGIMGILLLLLLLALRVRNRDRHAYEQAT